MSRMWCNFTVFILVVIWGFANPLSAQKATQSKGTLIVLNKSEASASLISLDTDEVVATVATGHGPHEVAISPDGKTAVVSNYGVRGEPGSTLTVIDLTTAKVTSTIDLGKYQRPHGLVFLPDGERLLVTAEAQKKLLLVHLASAKIVKAVDTGQEVSHMVVFVPEVQNAFVANIGSGTVTVLDLVDLKKITDIVTGAGAEGIDASPTGKEVWVSNRADNSLSVIDTKSRQVVQKLESQSFPIRVKFTPDGKYVLVSNARSGDVKVFDAWTKKGIKTISMNVESVAGKEERLFSDRFGKSPVPVGILIHPDGQRAYVANTNADIITVIELENWQVVNRLQAGKEPDGMGFSPIQMSDYSKK